MAESEATRWEYETLRPPRDETRKEAEEPKAELNQLGADGWEFMGTIDYEGMSLSTSFSNALPYRVSQYD